MLHLDCTYDVTGTERAVGQSYIDTRLEPGPRLLRIIQVRSIVAKQPIEYQVLE
jgi:hypothetical protein